MSSFRTRTGDSKEVRRDFPWPTTPGGGATAARAALTETTQQTLVAAPAGEQCIYVYQICGSNEGSTLTRLDVKEGTTVKFSFACAPLGGGFGQPLARAWKLPAATALTVQQSAAVNSFVSVLYEVE